MNARIGARMAVSLVALLASVPRQACAQSSNQVAAEALFREARKQLDAGNYREACEKLDASRRLDPAVGTLLNLARCREKTGQTATAWAAYHEAIRAAKAAGQTDRERTARERADALEPTLPRMTVIVSAEARADKVQIRRDGVALPPELWGVTVPVDPGEHTVEATAAGKKQWATKTNVEERATASITVPALEPMAASSSAGQDKAGARNTSSVPEQATSPAIVAGAKPVKASSAPEGADSERSTWPAGKTVALVLAGVGVAGLAVGTIEWLAFERKKDDADSACPAKGCFEAQHAIAAGYRSDAESARTIAVVGGVVGGVSLISATILWFTSGTAASGTSKLEIVPVVGKREWGVGLSGAW
jgi:hypothetical protein